MSSACPLNNVYLENGIRTYFCWYKILNTGSPKKHETQKTTWELLTGILERIKGPSIKTNMSKINVTLIEFYQIL